MAVLWSGGVAGVAYRLHPKTDMFEMWVVDLCLNSIGYRSTPRRLGKVYCSNRPGVIFFLKDGVWTELAGGERLVRVNLNQAESKLL